MRLSSLRGLIPLAVLLALWEVVGNPDAHTLPPPSRWWEALKSIEADGSLWPAVLETLELFAEALVIATAIGVTLGVALGASKTLSRALGPLLEFLRTTPAAAIVPGAILLFGVNARTEVGIVVFGSVWPILLNTAAARAALPQLRLDIAHSLHLSWASRMRKIVLPSLVPEILVGIRVAAPICFIITLLVDFLIATGGLGMLLVQFQGAFDAPSAFALVAVIGALGCLLNVAIGVAERLALRRWPTAAQH